MSSQETSELNFPDGPRISVIVPFWGATTKFGSRTFIIVSRSLSRNTQVLQQLKNVLGDDRVAGIYQDLRPHTLWSQILEIVDKVQASKPDTLLTLGAGSLTDAAKIVALAVANGSNSLEKLAQLQLRSVTMQDSLKPATMKIVCIPTSLSGGEYSSFAGATNDQTRHKELFTHPSIGPSEVILDPDLCTTTPERIWLSSGIRAVDHCVEAICSLQSTPDADNDAERALLLLIPGLLKTRKDPLSIDARLRSQLAVIRSMKAVRKGVPMGASHGIGHQLGPHGVGHGETSCIMLPAVMQFNAAVNSEKQAKIVDVLWSDSDISTLLKDNGYDHKNISLSSVLSVIIQTLGLPRSLKDVGIRGEDIQDQVARASLTDKACLSNPIPLRTKDQVLEIMKNVY